MNSYEKRLSFLFFCCISCVLAANLSAQADTISNSIQPTASYKMDIELDAQTHIIDGKMQLSWTNPSADTIRSIYFHLYLNAFKNNQSTWLKGAGEVPQHALAYEKEELIWGWCDINSIQDVDANDLTRGIEFIQPDDDNLADETVIYVALENAVLPYQTATFLIDFQSKLPKAMVRTGYSNDYHFAVQWFPKIGVYEPAGMRWSKSGKWNCHQYNRNTEYYADFGNYDVSITAPSDYIIGASGEQVAKINNDDGTTKHQFKVENVIDFAWTASPNFLVIEDTWEDIAIRLYINPEHADQQHRYLNSLKHSLEYFAKHLEKYPYPTISIVVPPLRGVMTSSMEYPTLFSAPGLAGLPEHIRFPETITVHEFTHQYFMQMVASNEMEEPWLDEGFTTYWEGRIMDEYYGEKTSGFNVLNIRGGNQESTRAQFHAMFNPKVAAIATEPIPFQFNGLRNMAYDKTGVVLKTLEGLVGVETMNAIMKTYFARWKFKHPCGDDFIRIANEVTNERHGTKFGDNLNWFFEQAIYGTAVCDYSVGRISNYQEEQPFGIFDDKTKPIYSDEVAKDTSGIYKSRVVLYRNGEFILPQEILVGFENGDTKLEYWDGKSRAFELTYEGKSKVQYAHLDPNRRYPLDYNYLNNSQTKVPEKWSIRKYVIKFMNWVQQAMQTMSFLV